MTLSVSSFFQYYMFFPEKAENERDRAIAMITTIALGILTLGFAHLISYICHSSLTFDRKISVKLAKDHKDEKTATAFKEAIDDYHSPGAWYAGQGDGAEEGGKDHLAAKNTSSITTVGAESLILKEELTGKNEALLAAPDTTPAAISAISLSQKDLSQPQLEKEELEESLVPPPHSFAEESGSSDSKTLSQNCEMTTEDEAPSALGLQQSTLQETVIPEISTPKTQCGPTVIEECPATLIAHPEQGVKEESLSSPALLSQDEAAITALLPQDGSELAAQNPEKGADPTVSLAKTEKQFKKKPPKSPHLSEPLSKIREQAEKGGVEYQYAYALLYLTGEKGVRASNIKAQYWLRRAADQKHIKSMYELGKLLDRLSKKEGKTSQEAEEWFLKCSNLGFEKAASRLNVR